MRLLRDYPAIKDQPGCRCPEPRTWTEDRGRTTAGREYPLRICTGCGTVYVRLHPDETTCQPS